jgi:DNA topoisomerase-3
MPAIFMTYFIQRNTAVGYIKNFDFPYAPCRAQFIVTCVAGHIIHRDFDNSFSSWRAKDPALLFDAQIITSIPQDKVKIKDNLASQSRSCQMMVVWTDCDREGEAIGAEIASICRKSNPRITIKRAKFSAIIAQ